jgi:ribonuclease R
VPVTGGLMLELLELDGGAVPGGASAKRGGPVKRRIGQTRAKSAKIKRKVERRRRDR